MRCLYFLYSVKLTVLFYCSSLWSMDNVVEIDNFRLRLEHGVCSITGTNHREAICEDAFAIVQLSNYNKQIFSVTDSMYCVFDGHGGNIVSTYLAQFMPICIASSFQFCGIDCDVEDNLKKAFIMADTKASEIRLQGSTALVALFLGKTLYLANAGDSRAAFFETVNSDCRTFETTDHKPNELSERVRIEKLGVPISETPYKGDVIYRVSKILSTSRSIGDYLTYRNLKRYVVLNNKNDSDVLKIPGVSAEPDVYEIPLNPNIKFVIVATDGFWDKFTSEEATAIVNNLFTIGKSSQEISAILANMAQESGSRDDITVIVTRLLWQEIMDEEDTSATEEFIETNQ